MIYNKILFKKRTAFSAVLFILFAGAVYGAEDAGTENIISELEQKTGVKLSYFTVNDSDISSGILNKKAGKKADNEITVFMDISKNKYYFKQGRKTLDLVAGEFLKYAIENELAGAAPGPLTDKIHSLTAVLASEIASGKRVKLTSLDGVYVKPLKNILYKVTAKGPLNFLIKAFYKNMLLFLILYPLIIWFILVYAPGIFLNEKARNAGRKIWRTILFATSCVIIIRIVADYNGLVGVVAATLVLWMPFIAVAAAIFREEILKTFGWFEG